MRRRLEPVEAAVSAVAAGAGGGARATAAGEDMHARLAGGAGRGYIV